MTFRTAFLCHITSGSFIFFGVIAGIISGETLHINNWIYAMAGGMFIYIAVCDMVWRFLTFIFKEFIEV